MVKLFFSLKNHCVKYIRIQVIINRCPKLRFCLYTGTYVSEKAYSGIFYAVNFKLQVPEVKYVNSLTTLF